MSFVPADGEATYTSSDCRNTHSQMDMSSHSAATDDRSALIAALAAQLLWLSNIVRHAPVTAFMSSIDQSGRRLINNGQYWPTSIQQPMSLPLIQLLDELVPIWQELLERHSS